MTVILTAEVTLGYRGAVVGAQGAQGAQPPFVKMMRVFGTSEPPSSEHMLV